MLLSSVSICLEPSLDSPDALIAVGSSSALSVWLWFFFPCSSFLEKADKKQFKGAQWAQRYNMPALSVSGDETTSAVLRFDHTHTNT